MRRGHNSSWLTHNDTIIGVNLGADFTAEHEWGIDGIKKRLGIDSTGEPGIERRRAKRICSDSVGLKEDGDRLSLVVTWGYQEYWSQRDLDGKDCRCAEWAFREGDTLVCCWSGDSLIVRTNDDKGKTFLRDLHAALLSGGVAVWLGSSRLPILNAGLCLAIVDRVPEEYKATMRDADTNRERLTAAAEATGIKAKIDAANECWRKNREVETGRPCYDAAPYLYFALSPAWSPDGTVRFWLNPYHQDRNESGWFTVEQLEEWLQGKGPVVKGKNGVAKAKK